MRKDPKHLNVSIVLFKNDIEDVKNAIQSSLHSELINKLYLIDNSPTVEFESLNNIDKRIIYIFNNSNLGFGKAHNIALRKTIEEGISYHLVLNPDVYFKNGVLEDLYKFMEENKDVGLVAPKILYPSGEIQYQCKLLPTPFDLFGRRFLSFWPLKKYIDRRNEIYELRFTKYQKIMDVPSFQGSFLFIRTNILKQAGLFDERFFMYLEDIDLCRRIKKISRTIFYPYAEIYHTWERGSYKNKKLLLYHIVSAVKYFNKWGWLIDKERKKINYDTLKQFGFH